MKWFFFSKPKDLKPEDIVIVVIGPTGVGKSTFINTAAGEELLKVTPGLSPCTKDLAHVRCTFEDSNSRPVVFVDTPPFPDPEIGDASLSAEKQAGRKISEWIKNALGKHIKVTGILYLHSIAINRLTEPPNPHHEIFKTLCRDQSPANVVLVLTMCEKVYDKTVYQTRKDSLTEHWKRMMGEKAAIYCHVGTEESAWEGVKALGVRRGPEIS